MRLIRHDDRGIGRPQINESKASEPAAVAGPQSECSTSVSLAGLDIRRNSSGLVSWLASLLASTSLLVKLCPRTTSGAECSVTFECSDVVARAGLGLGSGAGAFRAEDLLPSSTSFLSSEGGAEWSSFDCTD